MTSKEALKKLFFDNKDLHVDIVLNDRNVCKIYNTIMQDLERLEKLNNIFSDSHICEIKAKFNEIECNSYKCKICPLGVGDGICLKNTFEHKWKLEEENKTLRNELHNLYGYGVEQAKKDLLEENAKLKQAIEILKEFNIELTFENDTYFMDCCKSNDIELNGIDWGDRVLTKEEFELLKEVLGNE